jgi:DNA-binding NarL/FixJ family response regulator
MTVETANYAMHNTYASCEYLIRKHAPRLMKTGGYIHRNKRIDSGVPQAQHRALILERKQKVLDLKAKGFTVQEIARQLLCHANTVWNTLKYEG